MMGFYGRYLGRVMKIIFRRNIGVTKGISVEYTEGTQSP
jgi:hypothetical protein